MSFQFSPETIVRQFEEEITKQEDIISFNQPLVADKSASIAPLVEERTGLTPKKVTYVTCGCYTSRYGARLTGCGSCARVTQNDQVRIDEINTEIALIHSGEGTAQAVTEAQAELERLREAAKPFMVEVQVRNEQRSADLEAQSLENTRLAELAEKEGGGQIDKKTLAAGGAAFLLLR